MAFSLLRFSARSVSLIFERSINTGVRNQVFANNFISCACNGHHIQQQPILRLPSIWENKSVPIISREYSKKPKDLKRNYKADSDSDSDSDGEEKKHGHRGETKFWRRKMRTIHRILDVNKDGVISFDDFKLMADRFVSLGHLSDQCQKDFYEIIQIVWEQQWGPVSPYNLVTMEQYLEDMHHVVNDRELRDKVHLFLPYLFRAVDKDKSGRISVEEFKLFFQCLGLSADAAVSTFTVIDQNADGKLSLEEFVALGREFLLSEDSHSVSQMFWGPLADH